MNVLLILILHKLFQKIEEEGTLPNSFSEARITLITKSKVLQENYKPVSLVNIDIKVLNKIPAKQIQPHIKRIIHHDQMKFIPGMVSLTSENKSV